MIKGWLKEPARKSAI